MSWLTHLFPDPVRRDPVRFRSAANALEGWVSIVANLVLFAAKLGLGFLSGSIALIADAFHTLSDTGTSVVLIVSARIARKPSDLQHPFGHQRAEAIATIIIATLLLVTGIEIAHSAVTRIFHPTHFSSEWWVIGLIFCTVVVKELLAQFSSRLGRLVHSQALRADAWHHRSDAVTTLLVVITFILGRYGLFAIDGYVGLAMALFIIYTGYDVSREAVDHLLGSAPDPDFIRKISQIAYSFPQVEDVHDIVLHQYGDNKIVSLHIEIPEDLSLHDAHEIAEQVERKIAQELKTHATIHFEPHRRHFDAATEAIRSVIAEEIKADRQMKSFHALRTERNEQDIHVFFDLVVEQGITENEIEKIRQSMTRAILESSQSIKNVTIKVEPSYPFQKQL